MVVSLITLACCDSVRRKTPHNFIFLGLFTLAEGFMLGTITARYEVNEVLLQLTPTSILNKAKMSLSFERLEY